MNAPVDAMQRNDSHPPEHSRGKWLIAALLTATSGALIAGWLMASMSGLPDASPPRVQRQSNDDASTTNAAKTAQPATEDVASEEVPPRAVTEAKPSAEASVLRDAKIQPEDIQQRLRQRVEYLASDDLEGRGVGTEGLDVAARYIADQFKSAGLDTSRYAGSPFHEFRRRSRLDLGSTNNLTVEGLEDGRKVEISLELGQDFTPISLSGSGTFDLPLVFTGYGITAPELEYDDYADLDVEGKAVVMLRHEPQRDDADSVFNGVELTDHSYFVTKITNAVEHGAAAVVFCSDRYELERNADNQNDADPLLEFRVRSRLGERRVPVVHCRRDVVERMLKATAGIELAELEKTIDRELKPRSMKLAHWRIRGEVSVLHKNKSLKNVVGVFDGKGPKAEETVIVGAHYDHLGYGGWGSLSFANENLIHNGADDNASGTAVLIEVARQITARPEPLDRRIVFIAFTAEEMGLVGSARYVRDPLVPLEQTVAMVNLDMVGRLRNNRLQVSGTGTAQAFNPLLDRMVDKYGFRLARDPSGYGPSDHSSFYTRGIPVMHFFTGLHENYHRPSDDSHTLNYEGMTRIARAVTDVVVELANAEERPRVARPEMQLALGDGSSSAVRGSASDVPFLGIAPDYDAEGKGYAVGRVVDGSPAEQAGFRRADVVIGFDGETVEDRDQLERLVKAKKPGDKVSLVIQRRSTEIEIELTLGSR